MLKFEFLFTLSADVGELISLGPCPLGERRVVYITSGTFEGPAMRGEILGGADWQILRSDGALELDARYAIKDARGEDVDPASYFFRATMRFETGASELAWLNKTIAVATAERKARRVEVQAFRLL